MARVNKPRSEQSLTSRRNLLKVAGVSGVSGLAGCTDFLGGGTNHGEPVELNFLIPNFLTLDDVHRRIAKQWEESLGVTLNRNVLDFTTWLERIYSPPIEYEDITVWTWLGNPERISPAFILGTLVSDSNNNAPKYQNSEYDQLYSDLLAAFDEGERNDIISDMQEIILEDSPAIEYFRQPEINALNTSRWDMDPTTLFGVAVPAIQTHHEATPNPEAFDTDELVLNIGAQERYERPNPLNVPSATLTIAFSHVYDTLRRWSIEGHFENWAAEDITAKDETTVEITLREDMMFHDGEPVTAEDLTFSLNMYSEYDFPKYSAFAETIEGATTKSENVTELSFKQPNSTFLETSAILYKIVPKHIWQPITENNDVPANYNMPIEEVVGSGPFKTVELNDQRMVFEANEDHWSDPEYDSWKHLSRESAEAIRGGIGEGTLDMVSQSPSADMAKSAADASDDVEFISTSGLYWMSIAFDLESEPTSDKALRKAFQKSLNAKVVKQVFFNDLGSVANGTFIHPDLDVGGDFPKIDQLYNVEEARSILEEAGYTWDDDDQLRMPTE